MKRSRAESVPPPMKTVGKYRLRRRLGSGGFAEVYDALDTVEGVAVALKIPRATDPTAVVDLRREIRIAASLDHPNILAVKNAEVYDGRIVVAYPLGEESLEHRLRRRLSVDRVLDLGRQVLEALAYAHSRRIIHCDVKPDNLILFPGMQLRLADFGIARIAMRTVRASGAGTVGYIAPEQAMGQPSPSSDVFSAGLVIYRMWTGALPEWPFDWPFNGHDRLRRKFSDPAIDFIRRSLHVDRRRRFASAEQMLQAYLRILPKARRRARPRPKRIEADARPDWRQVRQREFLRRHRGFLPMKASCSRCAGVIDEAMVACPWCGGPNRGTDQATSFPARCPRCRRGRKLDWPFCAWCYGGRFSDVASRPYSDVRYTGRCVNPGCERQEQMPWMRYCPWCRHKVKRKWRVVGQKRCPHCAWGVFDRYWEFCPWCSHRLPQRR